MRAHLLALALLLIPAAARAEPQTLCTLITEAATGAVLLEEGDCHSRTTPASTFKIPLAVMAYDAGLLTGAGTPVMSFRPGDPDWGGASWRRDTTPADWMRHSVVWYSQRLTHAMGADRLARYARAFGYGNADVSGDPGFGNGLDRAWIASSLHISPHEQAAFLRALVQGTLPAAPQAMQQARALVERQQVGGWEMHGKTGAAYPRRADRSFDYARGWGWYVGWATQGGRTLVFVRLTQAQGRSEASPGHLTRESLLQDWPVLAGQ